MHLIPWVWCKSVSWKFSSFIWCNVQVFFMYWTRRFLSLNVKDNFGVSLFLIIFWCYLVASHILIFRTFYNNVFVKQWYASIPRKTRLNKLKISYLSFLFYYVFIFIALKGVRWTWPKPTGPVQLDQPIFVPFFNGRVDQNIDVFYWLNKQLQI